MSVESSSGEVRPYDPESFILLVPFGGQLEPKINRDLMAHGIAVKRATFDQAGQIDTSLIPDVEHIKGIILSGGNDSVHDESARRIPEFVMDLDVPKLGICYGHQALLHALGGTVEQAEEAEYGDKEIDIDATNPLFNGIEASTTKVLMNHRDVVTVLPAGFYSLAESPLGTAGTTNGKDIYTVQFHPEADSTERGTDMLLNFAKICNIQPEPGFGVEQFRERYLKQATTEIQEKLRDGNIHITAFDSGGVDSATAHVITHNALAAIGRADRLTAVYIDNGLMRREDGDTIAVLNEMGYPVITEDRSSFFLHERVPLPLSEAGKYEGGRLPRMDDTVDPQIMRKIVKFGFIEAQRQIGARLRKEHPQFSVMALLQGTNLADKIESGDFSGDQIKEHHNSGVEQFVDLLIEPLSGVFKGDIRAIGKSLGLPESIVRRQPFPGPGLCLRIPANRHGEPDWALDGPQMSAQQKKLDSICYAVGGHALEGMFLPVQATGQKGDRRVRGNAVLLWGDYDPEAIHKLASDIPEKTEATRVLYTQTTPVQSTIPLPQMVNEASLEPLRDAEAAKSAILRQNGLEADLSQHYVASLPISLDGSGRPTLMTRMFRTGYMKLEDYIVGQAALGGRNVDEARFLKALREIAAMARTSYSGSVYDVTSKPPGTVELS